MLRRALPWAPILLAALLVGLVAATPARAAARITRGPYLQEASATGIALLWQTDAPVAPTVEYRPDGETGEAPWRTVGSGERGRSHAVTLTGLEPGGRYQYRIRLDGDLAYEGGSFRVLSPADADSLHFVVYGDNRTNHGPHADVVRAILRERPLPEVLIHTGDLVENGLRAEQWDTFFQVERELLARVALFPALGNHESNSPLYFQSFRVPGNGTAQARGRWYSFDAGPAHFVALDVAFSDIEPGSRQYRWLESDLARTDRPWKFVYFHYPPYNASAPHGSNVRLREALERLFLERQVSAVFAGHAHVYERAAGGGQPPLLYIVTGGGGAPSHAVGRQPWTQYTEASYHFVRVALRGDRITTVGIRANGTEFDRFEGRLDADGRLHAITPLEQAVVVPGPAAAQFLRSSQGVYVLGYTSLLTVVIPLGMAAAVRGRRTDAIPVPSGVAPLPAPPLQDPYAGWRGLPVLALAGGVAAVLLVVILPTAPLRWLFGFDSYSITLTAHGMTGVALVIAAVAAGNMGYRLAVHRAPSLSWLAATAGIAAGLSALSALLGNVLYAGYLRSGGPMEQLVRKAPEAHKVLFEFKEHVGLVPLPLAAAAAFIVWRYREDLRRDRHLAELVALILLLVSFYCLLPLGLGAAITRLRGIL